MTRGTKTNSIRESEIFYVMKVVKKKNCHDNSTRHIEKIVIGSSKISRSSGFSSGKV